MKFLRSRLTCLLLSFIAIQLIALNISSQVLIPFSYWRSTNSLAALVISDAVTYNYGTIAINIDADQIFTLTNTSNLEVTGITGSAFTGHTDSFGFKGGTFPGTGGNCGTILAGQASCIFVVTARRATAGARLATIRIDYNAKNAANQVVAQTATRDVAATFSGTPTRLVWVSPPSFIKVNDCVQFTVQTQDNVGNPINDISRTINLAINYNTANPQFYASLATCNASTPTITTTTITTSAPFSADVWVKITTISDPNGIAVASNAGLAGAAQNVYFTGNPNSLVMYAPPEAKAGVCYPIQIYTTDANGIPAVVGANLTVNLAKTGAAIYYSDASCVSSITTTTVSTGTYLKVVYIMDLTSQSVTATASATAYNPSVETILFNSTISWWNNSWLKRMRMDINNLDQTVAHTDQPVLVTINSSLISYSDTKTNGADIRFVASDNVTALDYEIESWNPTGNSQIWVRIPTILATSDKTHFYMYYKNPAAVDAQNKTGVWTSYWMVWHLNDNPTGAAPQYKDSTANGRNGTVSPTPPTQVTGVIGDSANLSNSADYITVNTNLQPVIGNNSTFSTWMRTSQTGTSLTYTAPAITGIEVGASVDDIFFGIVAQGVGGITNGSIAIGIGNTFVASSNYAINNDAWRHVTITRSTSGAAVFYVNGVQTNAGSGTAGAIAAGKTFDRIGAAIAGGNFNGQLDEVRLFNSVQTPDKIKADFKYMMNTHINYAPVELQ
ncbi:MAG: DUF2341 domain-containing protein [Bdellovibrio sp.]|nr:DUF2341 domain-containing protein [Bdellovibrio sp.]